MGKYLGMLQRDEWDVTVPFPFNRIYCKKNAELLPLAHPLSFSNNTGLQGSFLTILSFLLSLVILYRGMLRSLEQFGVFSTSVVWLFSQAVA